MGFLSGIGNAVGGVLKGAGGTLGSITGFGGVGGGKGLNYNPGFFDPLQPVNLDQTNTAYNQTQGGLSQQQAFINALSGLGGAGNQANVFSQQQQLANQLQSLADNTSTQPSLAQTQLSQATGQNVAQQAALMASQRGASNNAGLIARQAANLGQGAQQQAAGQGAILDVQQKLAVLGALQNQQNIMAGLANQQVSNQGQAIMGYNQAGQSQQNALLNAMNAYNQNKIGMQQNVKYASLFY